MLLLSLYVLVCSGQRADQLATELAIQVRHGVAKPFILTELRGFLPHWAVGPDEVGMPDEEVSKDLTLMLRAIGAPAKKKLPPFSVGQWSLAYDGFALTAAACGMLEYKHALAHKVRKLWFVLHETLCPPYDHLFLRSTASRSL